MAQPQVAPEISQAALITSCGDHSPSWPRSARVDGRSRGRNPLNSPPSSHGLIRSGCRGRRLSVGRCRCLASDFMHHPLLGTLLAKDV
jgi:hypothetical protein